MLRRTIELTRLSFRLRLWPRLLLVAGLAALSACAGQPAEVASRKEAQHYVAVAPGHYTPPGPATDPWGPYIVEAAARYDVPQSWIRGVMHQESDAQEYRGDGTLIISAKGAMGLMQVMPDTYDDLRSRYGYGDDPYDPHNNILAGTAYMRELYDTYGMPAFLAAYNAGPGRLDKYLAGKQALPDETRRYVAMIAPGIIADTPVGRSAGQELALNQVPIDIPPGLRFARSWRVASRHGRPGVTGRVYAVVDRHGRRRMVVETAAIERVATHATPPVRMQLAYLAPQRRHGWRLISAAQAEPLPIRRGAGGVGHWSIQVGAFGSQGLAIAAADTARGIAGGHPAIGTLHHARSTLYRARLTGLSREAALTACERLHHAGCIVISPAAQS